MDADQVFKVPSLKKKRPSLYCRETLDGLDDIWKRDSKAAQDPDMSVKPHNSCGNPMSTDQNRSDANNSNVETSIKRSGSQTEFTDTVQRSSHNKYVYAVGLLDELCKTVESSTDQIDANAEQFQASASNNTSRELFPGSCNNGVDSDMTPLIIPDESLVDSDSDCYACEVDWDSLTPPAPRSPGDHTVPDMYDLESAYPPSNCLAHSYDYLAAVWGAAPTPEVARYRELQVLPLQRISSSGLESIPSLEDHIVPDFYM